MATVNTPKRDLSRWMGYPLVALLVAGVLWRVEVETRMSQTVTAPQNCPSTQVREEFTGTWEEVVTAIPALIRQLL
ncbi:hypothetical protein [Dinghuibacter silviterrae]|nr:hypothetical protein [Dinghuibacter silviterrae]